MNPEGFGFVEEMEGDVRGSDEGEGGGGWGGERREGGEGWEGSAAGDGDGREGEMYGSDRERVGEVPGEDCKGREEKGEEEESVSSTILFVSCLSLLFPACSKTRAYIPPFSTS